MERTETKDSKHPVAPEQKYIRLQITGMSFCLATPVMGVLAGMYGFEDIAMTIALVMIVIGVLIFDIGRTGRRRLREQNKGE
ncbi:hypothetical protein [Candidatus Magnetobacterium casense]|uniref:Uncharacterized protein n=1 Tax=Candidatus Magnetobacterium casense TaxID=1455061 RepID=A0ABS6S377_9BACT|nr:hypothetical protein [Candidatus Magnetobacterium casensis]MBV6343291.1 hypothetical protein [Candidatus Magnetobacterium casensis]